MYKILALIVLLLALIWFFAPPKSQAAAAAATADKKKPTGSCQCNGSGGEPVSAAGGVTGFAL